jgi:hypothetical protein
MLVYRADGVPCDPCAALDRLILKTGPSGARTHDAVTDVLIDLGELESAVADRLFPDRDGLHPVATGFRSAALRAAHAVVASSAGEPAMRDLELARVADALQQMPRGELPAAVDLRVSEGYAYYALQPQSYVEAAARFADACGPGFAVCIGIRSIGTGLSAVVAASLERLGVGVSLYSVRPHGHPFNRQIRLREDLALALRMAAPGSHFLIVDEGPGLSGSSFASVARALGDIGVDADRIILFPSWNADPSKFRSDDARAIWNRHRRFCADADTAERFLARHPGAIDLSAGAWRDVLLGDHTAWPAVQPQHEVAKYWQHGSGTIARFAGLGRYGEAKRRRADALCSAGLGPPPGTLENGYLSLPFVEGRPGPHASEALIDAMGGHLAFLTRTFPRDRMPEVDALIEMTDTNVRQGLGGDAPALRLEQYRSVLDAAPCAAIDGRMFPHEWVHGRSGFVKVDALDHHCDHFFPGVQDAGWDVAAACFEFNLSDAARERLVARYAAASGDSEVAARLPFYDVAYAAFRLGYAVLARESLGDTGDGRRFEQVAERCRARLRQVLTAPSAP